MEVKNNCNFLILTNREKFEHINIKISKTFKDYFNLIDTYSYEINYIENSINSFKPKNKLNIKNFIDNQQSLIKDLVNIINNLLFSIKIHSNKTEDSSKNKKSIKSIIENNNTKINYIKNKSCFNNNIKSKNQFFSIKKKKKETTINQFINKPKEKEKEKEKNDISNKSKNSSKTNIISFSTKNKSFINNSNSFLSEINNIQNLNEIYKNYNNSKKSNVSQYRKKANKIRLKLGNYNIKKKEILNSSFQSINISQAKEKMKKSETCKSFDKIPISISISSISNMIHKSRSKSIVPLKLTDFSLKKDNIPYSTHNETVSEDKDKKNGILYIFSDNKANNLQKYDLDGKYHITPHRMTKEVLNSSYHILNKFEQKRNKKNFVDNRSKSVLF
jgi:hypothetical protein